MPSALPTLVTQFSELLGTLSDSQHGSRGGGSLHSVATTVSAGFMAATDKQTLDNLAARNIGSGSAGYIAYWEDEDTLTGESALVWNASSNFLGLNTPSPSVAFHMTTSTTSANTVTTTGLIDRTTTDTPAAGMGNRWSFRLPSTTTATQNAATFEVTWLDPTHASRASAFKFGAIRAGQGAFSYPLEISGGSNQATVITRLGYSAQTNDIQRWNNAGDTLTYAAISNIGQLTLKPVDAITNTLTTVATLGHNSTGTPAANFGGAIIGQLQSSTTADRDAARISWLWDTATDATRTSRLAFATVLNGGALASVIELVRDANGTFLYIGGGNQYFYGTSSGYISANGIQFSASNFGTTGTAVGLWRESGNLFAQAYTGAINLLPNVAAGYVANTSRRLSVTTTGALLSITEDAATNQVATILTAVANSTGAAATGFGARILTQLESTTTAAQNAAADDTEWTDATHAARTAQRRGYLAKNGTLTEAWRYDHLDSSTQTNAWLLFNNVLTRVEVGAADSGGTGYRLLRVTN